MGRMEPRRGRTSQTRTESKHSNRETITDDSTWLHDDIIPLLIHRSQHQRAALTMSLQVNLSSPDITKAYQDVLNARGVDWVILTYEKASNDLRVQSTGNGLDDLEEEFSDGRYKETLLHPISLFSHRAVVGFNTCLPE
jgi:hypothetical protein